MAKISIAIPTYNGAPYLEEGLESAVGQTFSDIEIVVVDDCSACAFARSARRVLACSAIALASGDIVPSFGS